MPDGRHAEEYITQPKGSKKKLFPVINMNDEDLQINLHTHNFTVDKTFYIHQCFANIPTDVWLGAKGHVCALCVFGSTQKDKEWA